MLPINTVIFDVYETLVHNDTALWIPTFDSICREQGLNLDGQSLWNQWRPIELQFRRYRTVLEDPEQSPPFKSYETAWKETFEQVFTTLKRGDPAAASRRMIAALQGREPFPETIDVLARLKQSCRFRLGILSNVDNANLAPLLQTLGIEFDAVVSSELAQAYKPHPRAFNRALDALGATPSETIYVGDSQFDDVQGAKGVGILSAWVNRYYSDSDISLPAPDYEIHNLSELLEILQVAER